MPLLASGSPVDVRGAVRTVLLLAAVLALALVLRDSPNGPAGADGATVPAPCPPDDPACEAARHGSPPPPTVIPASEVCLRGGYLCAGLEEGREVRVVRWHEDTGRLRIRIPAPGGVEAARARELQDAAARGIRAWHGRPFDIRVDLSDRPGDHDFVVSWFPTLGARELGRARTRWSRQDGRASLEVREFALATHDPWRPDQELRVGQVELTAAHEMGHALGLPHSDQPRDVMYPENTATRLTARDYITMSALYELENGAVVR